MSEFFASASSPLRTGGAVGPWRKGTIYFHTKSSGIWVAPRNQKKLEGRSPAAIAAKAIRLLSKGKFGYLGVVDKVAVDDAPSSRKRIHRLFLYNIKNSKPHRYDFRRAYADAIHRVLSSPSGLIHPNGRELLPASKLHAKQFRQLRATEKVALKAFFSRVSKSKSNSKSPKGVSHHVPGLSGPGSTAVPPPVPKPKPKSKSKSPGAIIKALAHLKPRSRSDEYRMAVRPATPSKSNSKSKSPPKLTSPAKVAAAAAVAAENAASLVISAAPAVLSARNKAAAAIAAEEAAAIVIAASPAPLSARNRADAAASAEKAAAVVIAAASPHKTPSPHKGTKTKSKSKSVSVIAKRPRREAAKAFAASNRYRKPYGK